MQQWRFELRLSLDNESGILLRNRATLIQQLEIPSLRKFISHFIHASFPFCCMSSLASLLVDIRNAFIMTTSSFFARTYVNIRIIL